MKLFDIFELDEKGILPRGEDEDAFLGKGNATTAILQEWSDEKFLKNLNALKRGFKFSILRPGDHYDYCAYIVKKEQALAYLRNNYHLDLSWIKCFFMLPSLEDSANDSPIAIGYCHVFIPKYNDKEILRYPVIAVFMETSFLHEFIHAARFSVNEKDADQDLEEKIAQNKYLTSSFCSSDINDWWFADVRRRLQTAFGDMYGYVFIRLNQQELMEIYSHSDPVQYVKEKSESHLKFKIMREKLGL